MFVAALSFSVICCRRFSNFCAIASEPENSENPVTLLNAYGFERTAVSARLACAAKEDAMVDQHWEQVGIFDAGCQKARNCKIPRARLAARLLA